MRSTSFAWDTRRKPWRTWRASVGGTWPATPWPRCTSRMAGRSAVSSTRRKSRLPGMRACTCMPRRRWAWSRRPRRTARASGGEMFGESEGSTAVELTWEAVRKILEGTKTIAVVGLSDKPDRDSHEIAGYLQKAGYRIIPVNPTINDTLGEHAYKSLRDIPEHVDVVQVFRRPEEVSAIVDDAIAIGAKVVWMQPGTENEEAAVRAKSAGLQAVMGACMRSVHRTLYAR